jgi:hypothetical protein
MQLDIFKNVIYADDLDLCRQEVLKMVRNEESITSFNHLVPKGVEGISIINEDSQEDIDRAWKSFSSLMNSFNIVAMSYLRGKGCHYERSLIQYKFKPLHIIYTQVDGVIDTETLKYVYPHYDSGAALDRLGNWKNAWSMIIPIQVTGEDGLVYESYDQTHYHQYTVGQAIIFERYLKHGGRLNDTLHQPRIIAQTRLVQLEDNSYMIVAG